MNLSVLLKHAESSAKRECRRKRWHCDDDLLQEVRLEVWLRSRNEDLSRKLVRTIASRKIVDIIRKRRGRSGCIPKKVNLTAREWRKISTVKWAKRTSHTAELDDIESLIEGRDLELFRLLRLGLCLEDIARIMDVSRNTAWRWRQELIKKIRELL